MSADQPLPFILDDFSLALYLGVRCKTLWYCVTAKKDLYSTFTIAKANGKRRPIHHPKRILKYIQRRISQVILSRLPVLPCVGAYVKGKSCRDSAEQHVQKNVLIKLDLQDFFPSHTRTRVRNFFKDLGYSHWVAGLIADLCTVHENGRHFVPQGSPASPSLCNHIAQRYLDTPLLAALEGSGWTYTRYSDDLALSHADAVTRSEVDALIARVDALAKGAGYRINWKKLRIQRPPTRQKMLGMVVNQHPNIPRDVYRRYRNIIFNCLEYGFFPNALRYGGEFIDAPQAFASHLKGKVSYFQSINPVHGAQLAEVLQRAIERHQNESFEDVYP